LATLDDRELLLVVWHHMLNQTGTILQADGSGPSGIPNGVVDFYDHDFWRANFGTVVGIATGTGSSTDLPSSVPEATTLLLLANCVTVGGPLRCLWRSRGRH
jgi:hypothetical protein